MLGGGRTVDTKPHGSGALPRTSSSQKMPSPGGLASAKGRSAASGAAESRPSPSTSTVAASLPVPRHLGAGSKGTSPTVAPSSDSAAATEAADSRASTEARALESIPRSDRIRFTLTDLTLGTTLGTGTFGRVRLARHKASKKYLALKILKKSEIIRLKQVDHIKSEVVILSMLSHPFIVNMLGHYQDERRLYMLLEYVPGGELFSHLRQQGRFPEDTARFYTAQITLAFQHLHDHNVIYRDLKPENLLINRDGNIKITDFGFAKIVPDRTWTLCGTPEYLAPEIIQSKGHGKSVDWWALGILIFEMIAGYPPFYDETPYGIYQKILGGKIDFPRHFDVKSKDLVRRLLTADKTKRLGCLRAGAEDIKVHKWFGKTNWDAVFRCAIPAPFVPMVRGEDDTSNFDEYPDSDEDTALPLSAKDRARFAEFDTF